MTASKKTLITAALAFACTALAILLVLGSLLERRKTTSPAAQGGASPDAVVGSAADSDLQQAEDSSTARAGVATAEAPPKSTTAATPTLQATDASSPQVEKSPRAFAEAQYAVLMDPRSTFEQKRDAFTLMAFYASKEQIETRTPEALDEAFRVLDYSDDERLREEIVGGFKGIKDPSVIQRLVALLANEPTAIVRKRVARSLLEHTADEDVLSALRRAAREDPDEKVREVAALAK